MNTSSGKTPGAGSGAMFDAIAPRYDLLNRLMSLGIDQRWRHKTVAALAPREGGRILDLATGTADLAIAIARRYPTARVEGLDPSANMLAIGREKVTRAGLGGRITLGDGVAEKLPFGDRSFDGISIAFGIRNIPDRPAALREMARVTRDGGRVAILELTEPRSGVLGPLARFHVHEVVPRLGALLSGAGEYRYLQESIAAFPPADVFANMMREAGLEMLAMEPLTFGVAHLWVATPARVRE